MLQDRPDENEKKERGEAVEPSSDAINMLPFELRFSYVAKAKDIDECDLEQAKALAKQFLFLYLGLRYYKSKAGIE